MWVVGSVYDKKTQECTGLYLQRTAEALLRMFSDFLENENSRIRQHPEDYSLVQVGMFDEEEGRLIGYDEEPYVLLATAESVLFRADRTNGAAHDEREHSMKVLTPEGV